MVSRLSGVSALVVAASLGCASAQEAGPRELDVLGLKIGTSPGQAVAIASTAVKHTQVSIKKEALTKGLFTTKPLTFGALITNDTPNGGAVEFVQLVFSQKPGDGLVLLTRREDYEALGQPVLMATLMDSILKKYGKPKFARDAGVDGHEMYWSYDPKIPATAAAAEEPRTLTNACVGDLEETAFADLIEGQVNRPADEIRQMSKCGVWLKVQILPSSTEKMVRSLHVSFGDLSKVADTYTYTAQMLDQGAAAAAAKLRKTAAAHKPKL